MDAFVVQLWSSQPRTLMSLEELRGSKQDRVMERSRATNSVCSDAVPLG